MQKWHLSNSIRAPSRHCVANNVQVRQIHMSRPCLDSERFKGSDSAKPASRESSFRSIRLEKANRDVQDLYRHWAAYKQSSDSNDSPDTPKFSGSRQLNLDVTGADTDIPVSHRPERKVLQISKGPGVQTPTTPKVSLRGPTDTRSSRAPTESVNARPPRSARLQGIREPSGRPVDARALGAERPAENTPRFTITREAIDSRVPLSRGAKSNDRYKSGGLVRAVTLEKSADSTSSRPKSRRDMPDAPRPLRRDRGRGRKMDRRRGGGRSSKQDEREYKELMEAYEREQEALHAPKPVAFEPSPAEAMDLHRYGPAILGGEIGMRGSIAQKKSTLDWYTNTQYIIDRKQSWRNTRHKEHTLEFMKGLERVNEGEDADILDSMFSGAYISARPQLRSRNTDVLSHVGRQAARNGSYEHGDEQGLVAKVQSLVASTPAGGAGQAAVSNR